MGSARGNAGPLVRQRRLRARYSQMDLAFDVGISPRHLSFVELGKSRPSPELLLAIAAHLDLPLRERNEWLLAAGHAPRYPHSSLDAPALAQVLASLRQLLDAHEPYPAVAIDGCWNIHLANDAAGRLTAELPHHLLEPRPNIFRIALHPDGLAGRSRNVANWSPYLLRGLELAAARTADPALRQLIEEAQTWPGLPPRTTWPHPPEEAAQPPVLTWQVTVDGHDLSFFTVMSTFGTPLDITLAELTVEMFFPADPATRELLHDWLGIQH